MKITRAMLDKGYVEIDRYDMKSWKEVNDYNESTKVAMERVQRIGGLRRAFKITNILLTVFVLIMSSPKLVTNNLYLGLAGLMIAALIICMVKKGYRIYAIVSFAFALFDFKFALVGVLNLVMYFLMYREEKIVSEMPGFPTFETLRIVTVDKKKEVDKMDYYEYPKNM